MEEEGKECQGDLKVAYNNRYRHAPTKGCVPIFIKMVNSFGNQKVSSYICKNYQEKSLMCKFEEIEGWRLSNGKTIREIKNAVHEKVNLGQIYLIISILLAYMGTISMQAQSCEGRVYLKNGIQQLYESNDRIDLPRKKRMFKFIETSFLANALAM